MLGRRLNALKELALVRSCTFAAAAALGFVALAGGGARAAAVVPDALYEALAKAPDIADGVATCASQAHESKAAAARRARSIASMVRMSGKVSDDFSDSYVLDARAGQTLSIVP